MEKQYEEAEQALFHTIQRQDESNDSFLARADVMWSRLRARKMTLQDLQAFITLRGSCLSAEDKKRVIMESESAGALTMKKVTESVRLLGASFFQEITGGKRNPRTKVYDSTTLVAGSMSESTDQDLALQIFCSTRLGSPVLMASRFSTTDDPTG